MHRQLATPDTPAFGVGADDLTRQHRTVRIEVSELRAMIDSCRATQRTDGYRQMLAVLVCRLRERLVLHFELEQDGAHAARIRASFPAAAGDLARFADEHDRLLSEAAALAMQLRTPDAPPDVEARTMRWLDALRQHEQAEELFLAQLEERP
ncbi:MAG: hemerythrin domain-containing protein [Candidatus Binatia bacterium]